MTCKAGGAGTVTQTAVELSQFISHYVLWIPTIFTAIQPLCFKTWLCKWGGEEDLSNVRF
jgi:hypothetical protein